MFAIFLCIMHKRISPPTELATLVGIKKERVLSLSLRLAIVCVRIFLLLLVQYVFEQHPHRAQFFVAQRLSVPVKTLLH